MLTAPFCDKYNSKLSKHYVNQENTYTFDPTTGSITK